MRDWQWLKTQQEGQFFERKSCYDRTGKRPKRRSTREVAYDVAETLSARLARKLADLGFLEPLSEKRGRRYVPGQRLIDTS